MTKYDCAQSGGQGDNPLFKCLSPTPPWLKKKMWLCFPGNLNSKNRMEYSQQMSCLGSALPSPGIN